MEESVKSMKTKVNLRETTYNKIIFINIYNYLFSLSQYVDRIPELIPGFLSGCFKFIPA